MARTLAMEVRWHTATTLRRATGHTQLTLEAQDNTDTHTDSRAQYHITKTMLLLNPNWTHGAGGDGMFLPNPVFVLRLVGRNGLVKTIFGLEAPTGLFLH